MSETPTGPPVHTDGTAPGAELHNYTNKVVSEDGTYVTITTHSERIEIIPQPLTPEELAEQKKTERTALAIAGGIGVLFFGLMGFLIYMDDKSMREPLVDPADPEPSK